MNLTKTVKIKTWKQMEKEFGLDEDGDIEVLEDRVYFVDTMEEYMPKDRIIKVDEHRAKWMTEEPNDMYWEVHGSEWFIVSEMIEEIIKD